MKLYLSYLGFIFLFSFFPGHIFASEIYVNGSVSGSDQPPIWHTNYTATGGAVGLAHAGHYAAINASASLGRLKLNMTTIGVGPYPYKSGYTGGDAHWDDTITIQPLDPALVGTAGTLIMTFHLSGKQTAQNLGPGGSVDYYVDYGHLEGHLQSGGFYGTPISSAATFTETKSFTFGSPFSYEMEMSGIVSQQAQSAGSAGEDLILTLGAMTAESSGGDVVGYTSVSSAGTAVENIITNGTSYAGFTATNNLGEKTALTLLGGTNLTAGSNEIVSATFIPPPDMNQFVSDAVDFSGTDTNLFVLQLTYDQIAALAQFGSETNVSLLWFNQSLDQWVNALEGNSDGGLAQHFFPGAYDPATEFQLGNFGVDTTHHVVWAVLDHNSEFAAGEAIASVLHFGDVRIETNGVSLQLSGDNDGQYVIESSSDLTDANWNILGLTALDDAGLGSFTDTNSVTAHPQRFYRARQ